MALMSDAAIFGKDADVAGFEIDSFRSGCAIDDSDLGCC